MRARVCRVETLVLVLAATAVLCARGHTTLVARDDGLAALGWDAPDVHFVFAAGARDDAASAAFVPATAAEWRGYALWAAARGHAGVDEALVRAQQGTFWHASSVPLRDAAGHDYRCYLERRQPEQQQQHQVLGDDDLNATSSTSSTSSATATTATKTSTGTGTNSGKALPTTDKETIDAYFRARDYRAAAALVAGACLRARAGAYTYELCPGRGARQQRLAADTGAVLEEYRLGRPGARDNAAHDRAAHARARAEASLAWIAAGRELAATHVTRFEHDRAGRRFVQHYSAGDECWATKLPRAAEVVYTCDPARAQPALTAVAEVAPCQYRLRVASPALCRHPFFAHSFGLPGAVGDASTDDASAAATTQHEDGEQQQKKQKKEATAEEEENSEEEEEKVGQLVLCVADRRPQDVPEGATLLFEQPDRATVLALVAEQREAATRAASERRLREKLEDLVRQGLVGSFSRDSGTQDATVTVTVAPSQQQQQQQTEDSDNKKANAENKEEEADEDDDDGLEDDDYEDEDEEEDEDEDSALFGL